MEGEKKMKKILALLLVLCMMLAAIPALAEDFSGEWHFLIGTVEAGICTLNADGTASISVNLGEEMSAEGTWSVEGDTITVVADGSPMDFTFDGTVYTSAVMPMSLSREAGKVTVAQLMEYMSTQTLPEGVSEDDMAEALASFMSLAMAGNEGAPADDATPTPEPAAADPEPQAEGAGTLTVLDENSFARKNYSGKDEYWIFLTLKNETDGALYIRNASAALQDADGNEVGASKYMYGACSRYLEPGEVTYLSLQPELTAEDAAPAHYTYAIEVVEPEDWNDKDHALDVSEVGFESVLEEAGSYKNVLKGQFKLTNSGDEARSDIHLYMILKDENGKVLEIRSDSLYNLALCPGSSIIYSGNFSSSIADYCITNSVTPAEVEVIANWEE